MNRRDFFGTLVASLALDPERLLWVPGKKLISIPNPTPLALTETGLRLNIIRSYDCITDRLITRMDCKVVLIS